MDDVSAALSYARDIEMWMGHRDIHAM